MNRTSHVALASPVRSTGFRRLRVAAAAFVATAVLSAAGGWAMVPAHAAPAPGGGVNAAETPTPIDDDVNPDLLGDPNSGAQTWSIQTATVNGPDKRGSFTSNVRPGQKVSDHVAVTNFGLKPLKINLYATDAINTDSGEFTLLAKKDKPTDAGKWIAIPQSTITLPARTQMVLPFNTYVPNNAEPGDHAAGIVASVEANKVDAKGANVKVEQRVGVRSYLRVLGELNAAVAIKDMSVTYSGGINPLGGPATVKYTIENTGNIRVDLEHTTTLKGLFGIGEKTLSAAPQDELLPGQTIAVVQVYDDVLPTLRLSAQATVNAAPSGDTTDSTQVTASASASTWAIPWALIIAIVLLVLLVIGGRRLNERRKVRAEAKQTAAIDAAVAAATASLADGEGTKATSGATADADGDTPEK